MTHHRIVYIRFGRKLIDITIPADSRRGRVLHTLAMANARCRWYLTEPGYRAGRRQGLYGRDFYRR